MLRIRPEQLDTLTIDRRARHLAEDLVADVRALDDERYEALSDRELRTRVEAAMRRAARFGLDGDPALRVFVMMLFRIGPYFDERPAIRAILELEVSANDKLDRLAALPDREWAVASITSDPERWAELLRERAR